MPNKRHRSSSGALRTRAAALLFFGVLPLPTPAASTACNVDALKSQGLKQAADYDFAQARTTFQLAADCAVRAGRNDLVHRIWNAAGAANLYQLRYSEALDYFLRARDGACKLNDQELRAVYASNISSIYTMLGAGEAARSALDEAVAALPSRSKYLPQLMAQRVRLAFRRGDLEAALALWPGAMQAAQGDWQSERHLWDELALICQSRSDLACAERALDNEFRIVTLHRLPFRDYVFMRLGRLRLAQRRPQEALVWFHRARTQRRLAPSPIVPWMSDQDVASALMECRRPEEAISAYRAAWKTAVAWRQDVLPSQTAEVAADVSLANLARNYASLAMRLPADRPATTLQREAWAAVELERASGLRRIAAARQSNRERLGSEYAQTLATWRKALAASLSASAPIRRPDIEALSAKLTDLESRAGVGPGPAVPTASPESLLQLIQRNLRSDQVLFTFFLDDTRSWRWTITREGFSTAPLPGRGEVVPLLASFRQAVMENRHEASNLGANLAGKLFGGLPSDARSRNRWLISAGDEILLAPLAALPSTPSAGAPFLAETHELRLVPSALWLAHSPPRPQPASLLAIGDAIHNSADPRAPRWTRRQPDDTLLSSFPSWIRPVQAASKPFELPALPGSRAEIGMVVSLFLQAQLKAASLTGNNAVEQNVEAALRHPASVIHFATHVVQVPREMPSFLLSQHYQPGAGAGFTAILHPDEAFLALSLRDDGTRDGISSDLVSAFHVPGSLVVLSGCNSGLGAIQPGAGLMGFTRAWLAAGARSVVASLWPVPDDGGVLFSRFYTAHLGGRPSASALRDAQIAMIRQGSWASQPRYWAAYFTVGSE